jgi:hypothetical protein
MATLTVTPITRSGVDVTIASGLAAAAGGGDAFANTGQEYFIINNGDGSDHTVTFALTKTVDGVTPTPVAHNVVAGKTRIFGPFSPGDYNDTNGLVQVTYSAVTSVKVAVVKGVSVGHD